MTKSIPKQKALWVTATLAMAIASPWLMDTLWPGGSGGNEGPAVNEKPDERPDEKPDEKQAGQTRRNVEVVAFEPPLSHSTSQLPLSQRIPDDFLLVTGQFEKPQWVDGERFVEFTVDRVLRGAMEEGKFLTKDEMPIFRCTFVGSQRFPLGEPQACWLDRADGEWTVLEIQPLTRRYKKLLEAGVSDDPVAAFRPLITPHGLDYYSIEIVKIFALEDKLKLLMIELIRDTPPLLEDCQDAKPYDAKWEKRQQLLAGRLIPALEILGEQTQFSDPSQIELLLPCYEILKGEELKDLRLYLHYHLSAICRMAQFQPDKVRLTEKQRRACRALFLADAQGFGKTWSHTGATACTALANIADPVCITALLEEQARRPISRGHVTIAAALAHAVVEADLSDEEADRIQQAWLETVRSLPSDDVVADGPLAEMHASQFANAVAGGLFRRGLQPNELDAVLAIYAKTDRKWLKEALDRFLPEP